MVADLDIFRFLNDMKLAEQKKMIYGFKKRRHYFIF